MTEDEIIARTEKRFPELAKRSYAPIDAELSRLMDLAGKMPIGAFAREVEAAIERAASLYPLMDQRPIQDELESAIGEAIIGGLTP